MNKYSKLARLPAYLAVSACAFAGTVPAHAQPSPLDPREMVARYPRGSIDTVEAADRALEEVSRSRAAIRTRYEQEEQACLPKFFVTACVDKAKERQRQELQLLRPIELESNKLKRQARIEQRDADLMDKQQKADAKRLEAESAPVRATEQLRPPAPERTGKPGEPRTTEERVAEHEARMRTWQAKEDAKAPEREARAASFERKQQAALKRQEEVARRKAEKEAKRRAKEQDNPESSSAEVMRP